MFQEPFQPLGVVKFYRKISKSIDQQCCKGKVLKKIKGIPGMEHLAVLQGCAGLEIVQFYSVHIFKDIADPRMEMFGLDGGAKGFFYLIRRKILDDPYDTAVIREKQASFKAAFHGIAQIGHRKGCQLAVKNDLQTYMFLMEPGGIQDPFLIETALLSLEKILYSLA